MLWKTFTERAGTDVSEPPELHQGRLATAVLITCRTSLRNSLIIQTNCSLQARNFLDVSHAVGVMVKDRVRIFKGSSHVVGVLDTVSGQARL